MIGTVLQDASGTGARVLPDVDFPMWAVLLEKLGLSTTLVIGGLVFLWRLGPPLSKAILARARQADRLTEQLPVMMRVFERIATCLERLAATHAAPTLRERPENDREDGG